VLTVCRVSRVRHAVVSVVTYCGWRAALNSCNVYLISRLAAYCGNASQFCLTSLRCAAVTSPKFGHQGRQPASLGEIPGI
jgi:hypothetical protein